MRFRHIHLSIYFSLTFFFRSIWCNETWKLLFQSNNVVFGSIFVIYLPHCVHVTGLSSKQMELVNIEYDIRINRNFDCWIFFYRKALKFWQKKTDHSTLGIVREIKLFFVFLKISFARNLLIYFFNVNKISYSQIYCTCSDQKTRIEFSFASKSTYFQYQRWECRS